MSDLAALIDLVELDLKDSGNDEWSEAEITAHIRRALQQYSRIDPQRAVGELSSTADTREYSHATLTGLQVITDIWFPYDPAAPEYPPNRPAWSTIYNDTLRLEVADPPSGAATEKIRVFYTKPHIIENLDAGAATSLDADGEGIVILGATAFAAEQYCQSMLNRIAVSKSTPVYIRQWADSRTAAYRLALKQLTDRINQATDPRASWDGAI